MTDRPIASRSSSDDAALNLVKRLALDSRTVTFELVSAGAGASIGADIGLPFAALSLTNGARITFSHGLRPA